MSTFNFGSNNTFGDNNTFKGVSMNWIKITPETELPEKLCLVGFNTAVGFDWKKGTLIPLRSGSVICIVENGPPPSDPTHFMIITNPED